MSRTLNRRMLSAVGAAVMGLSLTAGTSAASAAATDPIPDGASFYVPKVDHGAQRQMADLRSSGQKQDAELIREMVRTPSAVWFTKGTPESVRREVKATVQRAAGKKTIPVLVAYNLPFRDCAQYSAGGATTVEEYKTWIDAFAAGIGDREVVVILEPDGLGIIPWYTPFDKTEPEWCRPAEADADTAAAERFEMLNYAVDALKARPNASVYLDGTHSAWLSVGDVSDRLIKAGVQDADGFFLNVSNYQTTERQLKFGSWISQCIYLSTESWYQTGWCGSQYYPANPSDFSTWGLTDATYDKAFADTGLARDWSKMSHFVIDTSRNGQGPWTPPAGVYPDPQDWCNPPNRGLGIRPTTETGHPLADAYLWIKIPGESDGECARGLGPAGETVDPEWGVIDPAAGQWFPQQALELVRLANPELTPSKRSGR